MPGRVSSADPAQLHQFDGQSARLASELSSQAARLRAALDLFAARCTEGQFRVHVAGLDGALRGHAHNANELGHWVGQVGQRFEAADSSLLIVGHLPEMYPIINPATGQDGEDWFTRLLERIFRPTLPEEQRPDESPPQDDALLGKIQDFWRQLLQDTGEAERLPEMQLMQPGTGEPLPLYQPVAGRIGGIAGVGVGLGAAPRIYPWLRPGLISLYDWINSTAPSAPAPASATGSLVPPGPGAPTLGDALAGQDATRWGGLRDTIYNPWPPSDLPFDTIVRQAEGGPLPTPTPSRPIIRPAPAPSDQGSQTVPWLKDIDGEYGGWDLERDAINDEGLLGKPKRVIGWELTFLDGEADKWSGSTHWFSTPTSIKDRAWSYEARVAHLKAGLGTEIDFDEGEVRLGPFARFCAFEAETSKTLVGDRNLGFGVGGGLKLGEVSAFGGALIDADDVKAGAKVGLNIISVEGTAGMNVGGMNVGASAEIGLKFEFGFEVGEDTKIHFGPISVGLKIGQAL